MSGYRSIAKLLPNSLWGRLGMRNDKTKKSFVNDSNELVKIITNDSYEVSRFYELDNKSSLVSYESVLDAQTVQKNVNVVLTAYTAALARIHLYNYLDQLKKNILYYDIDSVMI